MQHTVKFYTWDPSPCPHSFSSQQLVTYLSQYGFPCSVLLSGDDHPPTPLTPLFHQPVSDLFSNLLTVPSSNPSSPSLSRILHQIIDDNPRFFCILPPNCLPEDRLLAYLMHHLASADTTNLYVCFSDILHANGSHYRPHYHSISCLIGSTYQLQHIPPSSTHLLKLLSPFLWHPLPSLLFFFNSLHFSALPFRIFILNPEAQGASNLVYAIPLSSTSKSSYPLALLRILFLRIIGLPISQQPSTPYTKRRGLSSRY